MKKLLLMILTLTFLFSLSACGEDNPPVEQEEESEEAKLDALSETINGTLINYTGSEISIETEDGTTLSFYNCHRAELLLINGIVPGNEVFLVYVGALDGANTDNVRIRKIIVADDNSDIYSLARKTEEDSSSITNTPASDPVSSDAENEKDKENAEDLEIAENTEGIDAIEDVKNLEGIGQAKPASGVDVDKTSGTGTIIGGVNVRADAKIGAEILGTLNDGTSVAVTGICKNGWYRIVFAGQTGFIWKDFISY